MGNAVSSDHLRQNSHRQDRFPSLDGQDLHAETLGGVVFFPHGISARARQIVPGQHGLDVHGALPALVKCVGSCGTGTKCVSRLMPGWSEKPRWCKITA